MPLSEAEKMARLPLVSNLTVDEVITVATTKKLPGRKIPFNKIAGAELKFGVFESLPEKDHFLITLVEEKDLEKHAMYKDMVSSLIFPQYRLELPDVSEKYQLIAYEPSLYHALGKLVDLFFRVINFKPIRIENWRVVKLNRADDLNSPIRTRARSSQDSTLQQSSQNTSNRSPRNQETSTSNTQPRRNTSSAPPMNQEASTSNIQPQRSSNTQNNIREENTEADSIRNQRDRSNSHRERNDQNTGYQQGLNNSNSNLRDQNYMDSRSTQDRNFHVSNLQENLQQDHNMIGTQPDDPEEIRRIMRESIDSYNQDMKFRVNLPDKSQRVGRYYLIEGLIPVDYNIWKKKNLRCSEPKKVISALIRNILAPSYGLTTESWKGKARDGSKGIATVILQKHDIVFSSNIEKEKTEEQIRDTLIVHTFRNVPDRTDFNRIEYDRAGHYFTVVLADIKHKYLQKQRQLAANNE